MDFIKISSIVELDPKSGQKLSVPAAEIAQAESLTAHAAAARLRAADFRTLEKL
jgi:histidinol dehydrogenase